MNAHAKAWAETYLCHGLFQSLKCGYGDGSTLLNFKGFIGTVKHNLS